MAVTLRSFMPPPFRKGAPIVAAVRLSGVIGAASRFQSGLSLNGIASLLERAFATGGLKAVALLINSPGGSPVQSKLIVKRIRALAEENEVPVLAFAEDVAASGGYMLACAGDEIYADESSILGSIGVISAGFGYDQLIAKIGVERRVHTAGTNKGMLDPFQPEKEDDVQRLKEIHREVHEDFIKLVRERRGERLKTDHPDLFSGAFWTGEKAVALGLADGIGDARTILHEKFGEKVKIRVIAAPKPFWMPSSGGGAFARSSHGPASGLSEDLLNGLETRALWARFGL